MKDLPSLVTVLFNNINIHIHAQLQKGMEKILISSGAILKPAWDSLGSGVAGNTTPAIFGREGRPFVSTLLR